MKDVFSPVDGTFTIKDAENGTETQVFKQYNASGNNLLSLISVMNKVQSDIIAALLEETDKDGK